MDVKVIKAGSNIRAIFDFSNIDEVPTEMLPYIDKGALVKRMKDVKIKMVEAILEGLTEQYQDETNPIRRDELMAKIKEGKELLAHIKNNDCVCKKCKEGMEANAQGELTDILKANGIHMN